MRFAGLIATILVVVLGVAGVGQARPADPRDAKRQVDAELAQVAAALEAASAEAQQAVAQLAAAEAAIPVAEQRVAQAQGAVAAAAAAAITAQREAAAAKETAVAADEAYGEVARQVQAGRTALGRFVSITYRGGDVATFNALMSAAGPRDLLDRTGYIRQIAMVREQAIDQLVAARRAAREVAGEATLAQRAARTAAQVAEDTEVAAAAARNTAEQAAQHLVSLAELRKDALDAAQAHRSAVLAKYEEVQRESERIAAELRAFEAQQNPGGPVLQAGAQMLMPVRGWKSSDYGMRFDPYYAVWQLHAGIDIAAGGGEPIYAAADGQVAAAGWRGGYGNYTCLSHGRYQGQHLSTCYAHQSRILVNYGQHVSQGQLIGRVGTTGASTGYHLHFEVRLDGNPIDPMNWLPGCLC